MRPIQHYTLYCMNLMSQNMRCSGNVGVCADQLITWLLILSREHVVFSCITFLVTCSNSTTRHHYTVCESVGGLVLGSVGSRLDVLGGVLQMRYSTVGLLTLLKGCAFATLPLGSSLQSWEEMNGSQWTILSCSASGSSILYLPLKEEEGRRTWPLRWKNNA